MTQGLDPVDFPPQHFVIVAILDLLPPTEHAKRMFTIAGMFDRGGNNESPQRFRMVQIETRPALFRRRRWGNWVRFVDLRKE